MSIYYYMHACMSPICPGTSHQVHSYLFSFFMRESFSSCIMKLYKADKLIHQFSAKILETDLSTSIFQLNEDGGRATRKVFW